MPRSGQSTIKRCEHRTISNQRVPPPWGQVRGYPKHPDFRQRKFEQCLKDSTSLRPEFQGNPKSPVGRIFPKNTLCRNANSPHTNIVTDGVCLKKEFGQQTPRRWGWGTPLKKRAARPNTYTIGPFANKINNFLARSGPERPSVFFRPPPERRR